jgi:hypothetical protein
MPMATHTKAAEDHRAAADAHQTAAEMHGKGNHSAALEKSTTAKCCCDTANKSSADAHGKSAAQVKK